jgi:hypothetical protein
LAGCIVAILARVGRGGVLSSAFWFCHVPMTPKWFERIVWARTSKRTLLSSSRLFSAETFSIPVIFGSGVTSTRDENTDVPSAPPRLRPR